MNNPLNPLPSDPEKGILFLPKHNWSWFLLRGALAIALGALALVFPGLTVLTFALIFAAFSFVDGVFSIIAGIRGAQRHADRWLALVLSGVIGVAIGVLFFLWPATSATVYALLMVLFIAVWAVLTGLLEIITAIRLRREVAGEWMLALAGTLSVLLGIALAGVAFAAPAIAVLWAAWLIGFYALLSGVLLVLLALRLKRDQG